MIEDVCGARINNTHPHLTPADPNLRLTRPDRVDQTKMGNWWSTPAYLDGLQLPSPIARTNAAEAHRKLEQLLHASIITFRPSLLAVPLTAAFFLGAGPTELTKFYEKWSSQAEIWPEDDPVADSIGENNFDDFIGDRRYEQRYFEYFRDLLTEKSDWETVVRMHMADLAGKLALGGFRPLKVLAAGLEAQNGLIAFSGLTMACTLQGETVVVPVESSVGDLGGRLRNLAKRALSLQDYECVTTVQAAIEVFLSPSKLLTLDQKLPVLAALEKFVYSHEPGSCERLGVDALAEGSAESIAFSRAAMVLEKVCR